ncbi:MAG: hypothetical protein JSS00_06445 [Proteobacteria bacterium]|nr:hypothetical protein [Pseudomonadota bacterium]
MNDSSWVLKGVDPTARDRAVREAARRGIPLADYLTDVVLQNALAEQLRDPDGASAEAAEAPAGKSFAARHRIKALERSLGSSVTNLDGALGALDAALSDLADRVGELETATGHSAHDLGEQLQGLHSDLADLRDGLAAFQDIGNAAQHSNAAAHATLADACGELERRLEEIEAVARGAERAAVQLSATQQAYRVSAAQDLEALSRETRAQLRAGLDHVRVAADEAAAQADAAAAQLIAEMRALRQSIDNRLTESAAETKHRMRAAFAESGERIAALSERIATGERQSERYAEHVRAQIADVEDGAQSALEETALTLRRADAVLAADIVRTGESSRVAIEALRADISAQTAALNERQIEAAARAAAVDAKIAAVSNEAKAEREALERRIAAASVSLRDAIDDIDTTVSEQIDAAAARASELEQDITHVRRTLSAEINRVEACTLAALEKQAKDRTAGDSHARRAADEIAATARSAIEDMRLRVEEQMAALRGQQANAQARLDAVDATLANDGPLATVVSATADEVASLRKRVLHIQAADRDMTDRVVRLERSDADAAGAIEMLHKRVEAVAAQVPSGEAERIQRLELSVSEFAKAAPAREAAAAIAAVQAQLADIDKRQTDALQRLRGEIAQLLPAVDPGRIHSLELALADLRLSQLASVPPADDPSETLAAVQARVADLEERQAESLHRLRNDIAQFVAENERRLALIEDAAPDLAAPFMAIEQRLAELERYDIGVAFAELRARIEDRILGVEQRNVRTLEQLSGTIALIERHFDSAEGDEAAAKSA